MGLFGGFKAKFTRNSTEKHKNNEVVCLRYHVISEFDKQDSPERVPPSSVKTDIKKNEVIKKSSGSRTRSSIVASNSSIFEKSNGSPTLPTPTNEFTSALLKAKSLPNLNAPDQNTENLKTSSKSSKKTKSAKSKTKAKASEPPKTAEPNQQSPKTTTSVSRNPLSQIKTSENKNNYDTFITNSNSNSAEELTFATSVVVPIKTNATSLTAVKTKFDRRINENNGEAVEEVTLQKTQRSVVLTQDEKTEIQKKSILKSQTAYEETGQHVFDRYQDQSTLIYNRNNNNYGDRTSTFTTFKSVEKSTPDYDYASISLSKTQTYSDNDTASIKTNEDDFKINVVQHDAKYYDNNEYSEDEMSHDDEFDSHRDQVTASSGYSSHATSIFFGGDEMEVVRPRKINLQDEDEEKRRDSSVDC